MPYILCDTTDTEKICGRYRTRIDAYRAATSWSKPGKKRTFLLYLEFTGNPERDAAACKDDPEEVIETFDGQLFRQIPTGEPHTKRITPCLPDGTPAS
jgi:hypothetical protein